MSPWPAAAAIGILFAIAVMWVAHLAERARLWHRFEKACGGRKGALAVLEAAEATVDTATDAIAEAGMKSAAKRGWL